MSVNVSVSDLARCQGLVFSEYNILLGSVLVTFRRLVTDVARVF